jgi:hypothetical protein
MEHSEIVEMYLGFDFSLLENYQLSLQDQLYKDSSCKSLSQPGPTTVSSEAEAVTTEYYKAQENALQRILWLSAPHAWRLKLNHYQLLQWATKLLILCLSRLGDSPQKDCQFCRYFYFCGLVGLGEFCHR